MSTTANAEGAAPSDHLAMPEWLSRQDRGAGAWTVTAGLPVRGQAFTNIKDRTMTAPTGGDDASRVIRAHEMMHAKVSPVEVTGEMLKSCGYHGGMDAIVAAEELRVNRLLQVAGFDLSALCDGSEKVAGKRVAEAGMTAWNQVVLSVVAMHGTPACTAFINGIRSVDPELAKLAKKAQSSVARKVKSLMGRFAVSTVASTKTATWDGVQGLPHGFLEFTQPLAEFVNSLMLPQSDMPEAFGDPEDEAKRRIAAKGGAGLWADPVLDRSIPLTRHVDGRIGRKRIPSVTGRHPRHMERLLTDPERRVFERRSRGKGGVVLIDQSGSMSLDEEQINAMISAAPGCVIIGYSHRPGDTENTPNIWIHANRGKVAEVIRRGNGGNGVDGPALRFALSMRRTGEPFIWCCDGSVTDRYDQEHRALTEECAALVVKHRIHMAVDSSETIEALKRAGSGSLPMKMKGDIGRSTAAREALARE